MAGDPPQSLCSFCWNIQTQLNISIGPSLTQTNAIKCFQFEVDFGTKRSVFRECGSLYKSQPRLYCVWSIRVRFNMFIVQKVNRDRFNKCSVWFNAFSSFILLFCFVWMRSTWNMYLMLRSECRINNNPPSKIQELQWISKHLAFFSLLSVGQDPEFIYLYFLHSFKSKLNL